MNGIAHIPDLLVVDDNPMNLGVLSGILKEQGYQVRVANSGPRALEAARRTTPDLMMLDISMPGMDGFEVCMAMKADPNLAGVPVIFISAHDETMDKVRAFQVGGVDYVQKPFQAPEVLTRIEHQLKLASLTSALRTRNQELEDAKLRLEELDRLKSRFAAMLVHDLRNPLGAVRLGLEATIEGPEDLSYLPKCVTEINKCLSFLNELLEIYRTEARGMELQVAAVETRNLLNSTLDTFQMMAVEKAITLRREIEDKLPVIQGDIVRLDRVFANLLGNAMKFTPNGGSITLCADVQEGEGVDEGRQWLRVRIIDTGRGIPAQELPFVFDPYRQAMIKDSAHGAGLGLAIVSNIVAAHLGRITVQSQEGIGTCFVVLLPCNFQTLIPCISKP